MPTDLDWQLSNAVIAFVKIFLLIKWWFSLGQYISVCITCALPWKSIYKLFAVKVLNINIVIVVLISSSSAQLDLKPKTGSTFIRENIFAIKQILFPFLKPARDNPNLVRSCGQEKIVDGIGKKVSTKTLLAISRNFYGHLKFCYHFTTILSQNQIHRVKKEMVLKF